MTESQEMADAGDVSETRAEEPALADDAPPSLEGSDEAASASEEDPHASAGVEPVLTGEEAAALLGVMRDAARPEPERPSAEQDTSAIAPRSGLERKLPAADRGGAKLAQAIRESMLRSTAIMPGARSAPSDLPTLGEVLGAFDDTCASWTLRRSNTVVGGVVLGGALCRFLVDRRFGAPESKAPAPIQPAHVTPLERRVLEPFVRAALAGLLEAIEIPVDSVTLGVDTKTLSSIPGGASVLRVAAQVSVPATGDDEVFAFFLPHAFASPRKEPAPDVRREIAARVADAEVELSAILGRTSTTVRGLLSLQAGDVLRLDASPDSPIAVHIDEHPVLRGLPVVRRGNLAVEIVERLSVGGSTRGGRL